MCYNIDRAGESRRKNAPLLRKIGGNIMNGAEIMSTIKKAASADELAAIAKENGVELPPEKAGEIYDFVHRSGELSDDEIDAVGGCGLSQVFQRTSEQGGSSPSALGGGVKANDLVQRGSSGGFKVDDLVQRGGTGGLKIDDLVQRSGGRSGKSGSGLTSL